MYGYSGSWRSSPIGKILDMSKLFCGPVDTLFQKWFDLSIVDKDLRNALRSDAKRRLYQPKPKAVSNK
jgi:hypothetical protein